MEVVRLELPVGRLVWLARAVVHIPGRRFTSFGVAGETPEGAMANLRGLLGLCDKGALNGG